MRGAVRRNLLLATVAATAVALAVTLWVLRSTASGAVNVDLFGVAIGGYDPVAYFTLGRAVEGDSAYEVRWNEATWRFVSTRHRDMFADHPTRYAPQYGGFCAAGLAMGGKWKADPEVWTIVDGKLFLNYDRSGLEQLTAHPAQVVDEADRTWKASTAGD